MKNKIIAKNFISKIIFSLLNIALGFIVTPILLKLIGKEDYSLYKLTFDWLSSISFVEQVFTSSALAILANSTLSNRDTYSSYALKHFTKISLLFIFIAILLIPFLPYLFTIPVHKILQIQISFFIGSLCFIFLPITIIKTWIEFHEKGYLLNRFRNVQNILTAIVAIFFAWLSFGIIGQFCALFFGQLIFATLVYFYFRRHKEKSPNNISQTHSDLEFSKLFKQTNRHSFFLSLASKLSFFSDTLILGFFISPIQVLAFSLTQKLPQMIQENVQSLGNASWATLMDLYRNHNFDVFEKKLHALSKITVFLTLVGSLPLLFLNQSFISLWIGKEHYAGHAITIIAILNIYFMGLFSLWGWVLSGGGKIRIQIPIYVGNAVVNIICTLIFINLIGIEGPILGTLVGFLTIYALLIPKALEKEYGLSAKKLWRILTIPLLIIFPFILTSIKYQNYFNFNNLISWSFAYLALIFFVFIILVVLYLNKDERNFIKNLIRNKLKLNKT